MKNTVVSFPILEVCVDTLTGLEAATAGGADRIELCAALSTGGLTPSVGLMIEAARASVPVHALIRPRPGNFRYTETEIAVMKSDIAAARRAGVSGVVIGAATQQGRLDHVALAELIEAADGMDVTLHRVFDLIQEPLEALELAISLGFSRVLTSGGEPTVCAGLDRLVALNQAAAGRITVMPGGGITPENVGLVLDRLQVAELHASCSRLKEGANQRLVALGFEPPTRRITDREVVAALKAAMSR